MKTTCFAPWSREWRAIAGAALAALVALLTSGAAVPARAAASTAAVQYRVQPGDVLEITIWNLAQPTPVEAKVSPEGLLPVPLAGAIQVKDLTVPEVQQRVNEALKKEFRTPNAAVVLKTRHLNAGVYVLGAVMRPGPYELQEGMRVRDAVGLAGGLDPKADGTRATLSSGQKPPITIDLLKLLSGSNDGQNVILAFGDTINVPERDFLQAPRNMLTVLVVGQLARPGSVTLTPGARLSDAVTAAGGVAQYAALKKATLARRGETLPVDLDAVLKRGDVSGNVALQDGDVLLIPEQRNQVTLVGEFLKPGTYPFVDGDLVSSVGAVGGGTSKDADLRNATLTRGGKPRPLDLHAMLKEGDLKGDEALQSGDMIVVPAARREVTLVGQFVEPATYPFEEGNSISQALAKGKGTTPDADLRRAILKRGEQQIPVDLKALTEQGDLTQDLALQHGDVLIVPKGIKIMTQGALQKPGVVTVSEGMDVVDVLIASGNKTDKARLERSVVVRVVDGKPKEIKLDLKAAVEKGGEARNFAFQEGDVLYVPEKRAPLPWQAALNAMYLLALSAAQWK